MSTIKSMAVPAIIAFSLATRAQALTARGQECCFAIHAIGGPGGYMDQISDGQCRIGQSGLSGSQYCLSAGGGLTDNYGRGCIITDLNQLQCDAGKPAQIGVTIACDGTISFGSQHGLIGCPTGQNGGYNIYTKAPHNQDGCINVTLHAPDANCKPECPKPTSALVSSLKPTPTPTPSLVPIPPPKKQCPTELVGSWEFPHLIVPVDEDYPDYAYGTQFNGTVSSTVSTIFNFDIPASAAGKTCSLIFLFPEQEDLETSAFDFYPSGNSGIYVERLSSPADTNTTYNNAPKPASEYGLDEIIAAPGNSFHVADMEKCPAGQRIAYEMSSSSGTYLSWFQDFNPSPIGLYITIC